MGPNSVVSVSKRGNIRFEGQALSAAVRFFTEKQDVMAIRQHNVYDTVIFLDLMDGSIIYFFFSTPITVAEFVDMHPGVAEGLVPVCV